MRQLEQKFKEAYERYADEIFRHACLRLSDRERALELTQECFLRTWEYVKEGREVREFRPFLYRTIKNLVIDEYRKRKSYSLEAIVEKSGDEGGSIEMLMATDNTNTLERSMERFDGKKALSRLKDLPEEFREVLILRYVDSLSLKEIALTLRENENIISVRIYRALKKLRILCKEIL
ncbi:MAG: RNA polymerase sigma factor [Patescibacteria group bacterium]